MPKAPGGWNISDVDEESMIWLKDHIEKLSLHSFLLINFFI